jgi:hypothetical protein
MPWVGYLRTVTFARPPIVSQSEWHAAFARITPYGGQANDEDAPDGWPQAPLSYWYRRHDELDEPAPFALAANSADS